MKIFICILITISIITINTQKIAQAAPYVFYSLPAFKGKVLEAETKKPIEGAVVVAIYSKETASPLGTGTYTTIIGLSEILTDKDGNFDLPSFAKAIEPSTRGKVEFIVLKPGYGAICQSDLLQPRAGLFQTQAKITSIAAIKPSVIDYIEVHERDVKGQRLGYGTKVTKNFSEGLIYSVSGCENASKRIKNNKSFILEYFFLPLDDARKKIKNLNIPLDCPDGVEPVPHVDTKYDFRNEIQENVINSFTVIELPKASSAEEKKSAVDSCKIFNWEITEKDLPILYKTTTKNAN